jgi:hypothetical protein
LVALSLGTTGRSARCCGNLRASPPLSPQSPGPRSEAPELRRGLSFIVSAAERPLRVWLPALPGPASICRSSSSASAKFWIQAVNEAEVPHREAVSAAGLFVRERIVCGFKYARGTEVALRDWGHGLPSVIDQPKNLTVIAKCEEVARISGDLNYGPCHAVFPLGAMPAPLLWIRVCLKFSCAVVFFDAMSAAIGPRSGGALFSKDSIRKSKSCTAPRGGKPANAMRLPGCLRAGSSLGVRLPARVGDPQMNNFGPTGADRISVHGGQAGMHQSLQQFE